jgi:hypothetical protein
MVADTPDFSPVKELLFFATGCKKYHLDNNLRERFKCNCLRSLGTELAWVALPS